MDIFGLSSGSRALGRALGRIVGDGTQAHHLIPEITWNRNANFLNSIGLTRNMRDQASNGLLMPNSRANASAMGRRIFHSSRHRQYTALVERKLGRIASSFNMGEINSTQARQRVESLQRSLRKKINSGRISTKLLCGRLS